MTEHEIKIVSDMINKITATQNERNEKHTAWLKQIITLAVGLLSILVALKKSTEFSTAHHFWFVLTISLLSLGIFFGCIALFSEVQKLDALRAKLEKNTRALLDGTWEKEIFQLMPVEKVYKICERIALFSFSSALFSLIVYASFI